jgi:hypothetical protein
MCLSTPIRPTHRCLRTDRKRLVPGLLALAVLPKAVVLIAAARFSRTGLPPASGPSCLEQVVRSPRHYVGGSATVPGMSFETPASLTRPWTPAELRGWQNARRSEEFEAARAASAATGSAAIKRSAARQGASRRRDIAMLVATVGGAIGSVVAATLGVVSYLT